MQEGAAKNILLKYERTSNGVAVWQDCIEEFGNDGDKESRIANLEDVGQTPYTKGDRGGLNGCTLEYQDTLQNWNYLVKCLMLKRKARYARISKTVFLVITKMP